MSGRSPEANQLQHKALFLCKAEVWLYTLILVANWHGKQMLQLYTLNKTCQEYIYAGKMEIDKQTYQWWPKDDERQMYSVLGVSCQELFRAKLPDK